ncbi:MAG: D-alanyl-D-alanine carboxypeptidase/D-alanyl-D-alanine endopeptidase [Candidatus Xenobia bacterium]
MKKKLLLLILLLVFPVQAYAVASRGASHVRDHIAHLVNNASCLSGAAVGVYFKALDSNHVLYAHNPNSELNPASNFKVLTVGLALLKLGPAWRYETKLVVAKNATISNHVLHGNVYLVGSGDPTWLEPWTAPADAVLDDFARALVKAGVHRIDGDVIGDDSAFDREFLGRGWKKRYLNCDYAAQVGALSLNGNLVHVNVTSGGTYMYPRSRAIHIVHDKGHAGGALSLFRPLGTNDIHVSGSGSGEDSFTIQNPPLFTTDAFAAELMRHHIRVVGRVRLVGDAEKAPADGRVVSRHRSKPLFQILRYLCKESDNFFAQHVFKTIGYVVLGKGTLENSSKVVYDYMKQEGVDASGMTIADGCGLSVLDRISPRQVVDYLGAIYRSPIAKDFIATLPAAGKDGTMSYRLAGCPVWAKTGTINGTVTLCGYVRTKTGQMVAFSIMVNHHHVGNDTIRAWQDDIVRSVAAMTQPI